MDARRSGEAYRAWSYSGRHRGRTAEDPEGPVVARTGGAVHSGFDRKEQDALHLGCWQDAWQAPGDFRLLNASPYDYSFRHLPSQNAWKIRQLLGLMGVAYRQEFVSIFEGEGQAESFLRVNPWGAVPAIRLEDGRVVSESNAILWYLAQGSEFSPEDAFGSAKVQQWLSFEIDYIQNSVGSLRYWTLTDKLKGRPAQVVASKRAVASRALSVLDREFAQHPFILGNTLTIADIVLFAYAHLAQDANLDTRDLPHFRLG
ncbi:glutathione S-transferase family protein [Parapontixanthobacter aurantiacus]|uniref:glutathione S-transferase family protein n=1 Tax=Parapontixanthobacter aurantiacus TaxID=1463599 RepID=UPI0023517796|nr:glutathione S-transferase family protein [Parapontixanthobacter aurantiacus]